MNVTSVEIRGMHALDHKKYNLKDVNYIYGPNGCGKSTILQAIQLGLLGYIPGYSKKNSDIMKHANGPVMSVKLMFDNDTSIERTWIRNKSTVTANVTTEPEGLDLDMFLTDLTMPIFKFDEFLSLSSNKQKEWFLTHMKTEDSKIDWFNELHDAVESEIFETKQFEQDMFNEIKQIENESEGLSAIDICKKVNAHIKDVISLQKGSIQSLTNTLQSLVKYDDSDIIDDTVIKSKMSVLEAAKADLETAKAQAEKYANHQKSLSNYKVSYPADTVELDERYTQTCQNIETCKQTIDKLNNEISEISSKSSKLQSKVTKYTQQLRELQTEQSKYTSLASCNNTCPFTGNECAEVVPEIENAKTQYQNYQEQIDHTQDDIDKTRHEADVLGQTMSAKLQELDKHKRLVQSNEVNKAHLEQGYTFKQQLLEAVGNEPLKSVEEYETEISNIKAELEQKRDMLVKAEANKRYNELYNKVNNDKIQAEFYMTCLKNWKTLTDVNGLQNTLAAKPFESLTDNLTCYIQHVFGDTTSAYFNLSSQANSFDFGLKRNDQIVYFNTLSSGEQCLYMFAFMVCLLFGDEEPALPIILLDDVFDHLDSNNVETIMNAINLAGYNGVQFVFAGFNLINDRYKDYVIEP